VPFTANPFRLVWFFPPPSRQCRNFNHGSKNTTVDTRAQDWSGQNQTLKGPTYLIYQPLLPRVVGLRQSGNRCQIFTALTMPPPPVDKKNYDPQFKAASFLGWPGAPHREEQNLISTISCFATSPLLRRVRSPSSFSSWQSSQVVRSLPSILNLPPCGSSFTWVASSKTSSALRAPLETSKPALAFRLVF